MPLRLFVVSNETPFPPIHGGRVDQWSRFREFRKRGVRLACATWQSTNDGPGGPQLEPLQAVFDQFLVFPIDQSPLALFRRLMYLPFYSPHVSTRILRGEDRRRLIETARRFEPHAVWLDGLYGGVTARMISSELAIPLYYRSHNVEFRYIKEQARHGRTMRDKIAWNLAALHLERFETEIQRSSRLVFDISLDDMQFWRSRGISNNLWLPTLAVAPDVRPIGFESRSWDVVFLGNLSTPNNLEGLHWFVVQVVPLLRMRLPDVKILIAGSRPTSEVRAMLKEADILLCENPPDANEILRNGRVLINPILRGSGMNVKSIEMLNQDAFVVTTSAGVRGMPEPAKRQFLVSDTEEGFAAFCATSLQTPFALNDARLEARSQFGPKIVEQALSAMTANQPQ